MIICAHIYYPYLAEIDSSNLVNFDQIYRKKNNNSYTKFISLDPP